MPTEERREHLVRAALRVFATRDVGSVSVEELAREAGVSAALVHHYFGGRAGLAEAALGVAAEELMGALVLVDGPPLVQLDAALATYLDFLVEHPASWAALLRADGGDPAASAIARRVDDHAVQLCARTFGVRRPSTAFERAVRGWLDLVKGSCLRWLEAGARDRAALQDFLAMAFFGCLQAGGDGQCQRALAALGG